jgi:glycerol kinase
MNVGDTLPEPIDGLLTSVAWVLERPAVTAYALEGAIFVTGAAVQWLRDGLGIIGDATETESLAASIDDSEGVYLVPAFAGLGSPWWDPYARGTIVGLTRGSGRAHLARAVVEAMAYQTRDVVEAMTAASGHTVTSLRADGGASAMGLLLQLQADQLGVPVARPRFTDTTAVGAAYLAGLAEGVWGSLEELSGQWAADVEVTPRANGDAKYETWRRALERSRGWEKAAPGR